MIDLTSGRYLDVENGDVNCSYYNRRPDHDLSRKSSIRNDDTNAINDDLQ